MRRLSAAVVAIAVVLLMLPPLYVFSLGPVVWLQTRGYLGNEPARTIYSPLEYSYRIPVWGDALSWYVQPWALREPPPHSGG